MPVCSSPRIEWGNYAADKQTKKANAEAIVRHGSRLRLRAGQASVPQFKYRRIAFNRCRSQKSLHRNQCRLSAHCRKMQGQPQRKRHQLLHPLQAAQGAVLFYVRRVVTFQLPPSAAYMQGEYGCRRYPSRSKANLHQCAAPAILVCRQPENG